MEIDGTEVDDLLREWEKELDAARAELLQIDPLKGLEKLEQEAKPLLNELTAEYNTNQLEELAGDTDKELEALATEYAAEFDKLLEGRTEP